MSAAERSARDRFSSRDLLLYAVTDRAWLHGRSLADQVEEAILGGVTLVQLREKELEMDRFLKEAVEVKAVCRRHNVLFLINDNVEIALASGADGIHVGQEDMQAARARKLLGKDKIIGVSAHTLEEALQAQENGADYLGLGAVFPTSTKLDVDRMPQSTIQEICANVQIPVVAIGGINEKNLPLLHGSGVDGVAVVSALFAAGNIRAAAAALSALAKKEFFECK